MSSSEIDQEIWECARKRVGSVLRGKYSLDRLVGVGGMAAVYSATHQNLGSTVAIKMLHPQIGVSAELQRRFRLEGRAANAIAHPGVVRIIDDDVDDDGTAFLVMELLTGASLDKIWEERGRRLPVEVVLNVAGQILDVLDAAHAKGIAHRDVKPENVFVTESGDVKLVDFGVARMRDAAAGSGGTRTGMVIGTPGFMSPEQALGKTDQTDALCDVFAVGAVMFTLLTGRYIHEAETLTEALVLAATQQAPSVSSVAPGVPPLVAEIVDKALRFQRAERWQSARLMRNEVLAAHKALQAGAGTQQAAALSERLAPSAEVRREAASVSVLTPSPQSVSVSAQAEQHNTAGAPVHRRAILLGSIGSAAVLLIAVVVGVTAGRGTPETPVAEAPPTANSAAVLPGTSGPSIPSASATSSARDVADTPGLDPAALPTVSSPTKAAGATPPQPTPPAAGSTTAKTVPKATTDVTSKPPAKGPRPITTNF